MSLLITTFSETKNLAARVAKKLNAEFSQIIEKNFPDGESYLKLSKNPKGKILVIFNSFARNQNDRLIKTILAAGIGRDYNAKKVILVAPYFPYFRQDTHFEKYDSFSIKHIKKIFDNFDLILTIDPHLQRIKKVKNISYKFRKLESASLIANYIIKNIKKDFTIIGPDKESEQWANKVAKLLGKKALILEKIRYSWKKVKIKNKHLIRDFKNIIIIDDIIGTGNTILETIKIVKKNKADKIFVFGIHGVLVGNSAKKIKKYSMLITTNTINNKFAKIDVSPIICKELEKYL